MAINSQTSALLKEPFPEFPLLMKDKEEDYIILVNERSTSSLKGVVIHSNYPNYPVGHYSSYWAESCFEKFEHAIIIKNRD